MKKVIWSLFDSETAITQELNSDDYIVYSIGLPSSSAITENFIKMDLSKRSCLTKLEKLPKPDIIFASPPCETWVDVSIGLVGRYNRTYNEHNLYWQRNFKSNKFKKIFEQRRLLGQKTAFYTAEIVKKFNPDLWCIENGSSSMIFKYLNRYNNLKGYLNKCYYDSYDKVNFSKKPTTIFSNKKMLLKKTNVKNNNNRITTNNNFLNKVKKGLINIEDYNIKKDYCERSRVPIELYQHILSIYEGKEQLNLF
jgi:hypothetical protein